MLAIADAVGASPGYIAGTLRTSGRPVDYVDLYTPSRPLNRYGDEFASVLRFKDLDAARLSVETLDRLYHRYRLLGDRQGQYHAQHLALIGMHRAAGIGKFAEADEFAHWLQQRLSDPLDDIAESNN